MYFYYAFTIFQFPPCPVSDETDLTGSIPTEMENLLDFRTLYMGEFCRGYVYVWKSLLSDFSLTWCHANLYNPTFHKLSSMDNWFADNVTIPIPASLAPKVAEKCEVCGRSTLDTFDHTYANTTVHDYNGLNYTCFDIYRGMEESQGRIAAGECSAYKDICIDCDGLNQEDNYNPLDFLSALDP